MLGVNSENLKKIDENLYQSKIEFEILFHNSPSPYIIIDKDFNIINFNQEAQRYFNLKTLSKKLILYFDKTSQNRFLIWIDSDRYLKEDLEVELKCNLYREKNKRRFLIKGNKHPSSHEIFLFFVDIQDEYDAKHQLEIKLNNEIEQVRLKNELLIYQSKLSEMGEAIQDIAHQWRQPLHHINTALMDLELKIERKNLTEDYLLNNLKDIDQITNNLSNILDDFLRFFKSDDSKRKFNLVDVYKDIIKFSSYRLIKKDNISIIYDENELYLESYRNELTQVLLILINNSIDAIDSKKNEHRYNIEIKHYIKNDFFIIEVIDNAGGIDKKIINKIWEPYFSTKNKKKGVGIGLYIVKVIIENHLLGTALVESRNSETKFILKVPFNINLLK